MPDDQSHASGAPVIEMGLTVYSRHPGLFSDYDPKSIHDIFKADFPTASRQLPVQIQEGGQPFIQESDPNDPALRWWFGSADGTDLIQFQENMVALNWRRQALPPTLPKPYPGYEAQKRAFLEIISKLEGRLRDVGGSLPPPLVVDILYDNVFPLEADDGVLRIRDVITPFHLEPARPIANLNMAWQEPLSEFGRPAGINITINTPVMSIQDEAKLVVRVQLIGRSQMESWSQLEEAFDALHDAITERLRTLTTPQHRATW